MFEVRISTKAQKQIKQIKKSLQKAVIMALMELKENPLLGKPLTRNLTGQYACKVGGYRIIYKVNKSDRVVNVLSAGHRSKIYD